MSTAGAHPPTEAAREPLAALRARIADADAPALAALGERLARDPRAGARALAADCARRREALASERARLARIFARTAALHRAGAPHVAGVDEVGMGPLAGPVVAAAVILPADAWLPGLDDSKRLSAAARERLDREIRARAVALAVAEASVAEVDALNVHQAGLLAMRRAVSALGVAPDHCLVDARTIPGIGCGQTALVGGDASEGPIAAASIVAKVHRDALMCRLDRVHPGYGFADHAGYATRRHLEALRRLGPCPHHRRSFAPVASLLGAAPAAP